MESNQRKLVISAVIVAVVAGVLILINRSDRQRDLVLKIEPLESSDDVTVYVGGAVEEPGLYSLPRGSRVAEALDMAGRLEETDDSSLDLADALVDEQTVMVPEAAPTPEPDADVGDREPVDGVQIDINTATREELEFLPGIGPAFAERIVERRNTVGPFESLDELSEIAGISDRMVDDLRGLAVVDS